MRVSLQAWLAVNGKGQANSEFIVKGRNRGNIDFINDIFHACSSLYDRDCRVAIRIVTYVPGNCYRPVLDADCEIVEHDAIANAVIAKFVGKIVPKFEIRDSFSCYLNVIPDAINILDFANTLFRVHFVDEQIYCSGETQDSIIGSRRNRRELLICMQRFCREFLNLLILSVFSSVCFYLSR